jgi:hypothetical protein
MSTQRILAFSVALSCGLGLSLQAADDQAPVCISNADLKRPQSTSTNAITNLDLPKYKSAGYMTLITPAGPNATAAATASASATATASTESSSASSETPTQAPVASAETRAHADARLESTSPVTPAVAANVPMGCICVNGDCRGNCPKPKDKPKPGEKPSDAKPAIQEGQLCVCLANSCKPEGCNPFRQEGVIEVRSIQRKKKN